MTAVTERPPDPAEQLAADERRLVAYADALATAVESALAGWVERCVLATAAAAGVGSDADLADAARRAGERCRQELGPAVRTLLESDLDEQGTTPLALLRSGVRYPTEVLSAAGVAPVERDEFERRAFPEDHYGLSPTSFADVDDSLHEPGLVWGAAKAHVHLARRRLGR